MEFLIAGLLVLDLAVTVVGVHLLERNSRRRWCEIQSLLAETKRSLGEVNSSMAVLTHTVTAQGDQRGRERSEDAEVFDKFQASISSALSRIGDGNMAALCGIETRLRTLEKLLEDSPAVLSREREDSMNKAMEEGISSILGYTAGKVPGVKLRL